MNRWIGHDEQEQAFLHAMAGERPPHAWLLAGPKGLGKATFADRAARYLMAADLHSDMSFDDANASPAMRLVDAGSHPDYLLVQRVVSKSRAAKNDADDRDDNLARNITVDQVRSLIARLRTRPAIAQRRAVVIDSIDDMERGAANALLKTLEEPPADCILLLVSHAPGRLLPTIRSRCRMLRFAPLSDDVMRSIIRSGAPDIDDDEVGALVSIANGSPGRGLAFAKLKLAEVQDLMRKIVESGDADLALRNQLVRALSGAAGKARFEASFELAGAVLSEQAQQSAADQLPSILTARDRVSQIARYAVSASEDQAIVSMALGSALATVASARASMQTAY